MQLFEQPEKAKDILVRCYHEYKEVKGEIDSILHLSGQGKSQALHAPTNSAIPIPSHGSIRSHRRSPSSQLATSTHYPRGTTGSNAAPTPPGSSSARSSKSSSASEEMILLLNAHADGFEVHPVILRTDGAAKLILIREDVVRERIVGADPVEDSVELPDIAALPGACANVRIYESITLTWRRPKSLSTHRTKFFLVPKHFLNTDVLLRYEDSNRGNLGDPPHPQRQDYRGIDHRQEVQSPTVVPLSFHRSQFESVPYQKQSRHQYDQHANESYQYQVPRNLNEGTQQPAQHSPMSTSRNIRRTQKDYSLSTPPPVQIRSNNSETPNRKLRLSLTWDTTPLNLWLDLDSSAEVFFQKLRDISKRKQVHDWNLWVVWLKTELQSPDETAYRLALGEELDADWETTVDWLEQNKRDKSPHIYGSFEFQEGQ